MLRPSHWLFEVLKMKDYRKDAIEKSKTHWEMDVSDSIFPKAKKSNQLDNWIAKNPKQWPREHVKVNECDY